MGCLVFDGGMEGLMCFGGGGGGGLGFNNLRNQNFTIILFSLRDVLKL